MLRINRAIQNKPTMNCCRVSFFLIIQALFRAATAFSQTNRCNTRYNNGLLAVMEKLVGLFFAEIRHCQSNKPVKYNKVDGIK
jgi:hypothetical protein